MAGNVNNPISELPMAKSVIKSCKRPKCSPRTSAFLFIMFFCVESIVADQSLLVVSSLKTATSFIYRSNETINFNQYQTDIWRVCPPAFNTSQCYPSVVSTSACAILTPDCRCYTWQVLETPAIKKIDSCIYIQIPAPDKQPIAIKWILDYSYPVLPPGYTTYLEILNGRLMTNRISPSDYTTIMTPLICEKASEQHQNMPDFDDCQTQFIFNINYIVGVDRPPFHVSSVGKTVLITFGFIIFSVYLLFFSRKIKKNKQVFLRTKL